MRLELTELQRRAVQEQAGRPVEVIDPDTRRAYVLLAREQYERIRSGLESEPEPAHRAAEVTVGARGSRAARPPPPGRRPHRTVKILDRLPSFSDPTFVPAPGESVRVKPYQIITTGAPHARTLAQPHLGRQPGQKSSRVNSRPGP
jgi:hypothetical protein